jgi:hypothetical protein
VPDVESMKVREGKKFGEVRKAKSVASVDLDS